MINSAPYLSDFSAAARQAPLDAYPVMLVSGGGGADEFARFSVLAAAPLAILEAAGPLDACRLRAPDEESEPRRGSGSERTPLKSLEFDSFGAGVDAALGLIGPMDLSGGAPWDAPAQEAEEACGDEGAGDCMPTPFTGGLAGFVSYEAGGRFERMPPPPVSSTGIPAIWFGVYSAVYLADHLRREAWWISREAADGVANDEDTGRDALGMLRDWVDDARRAAHGLESGDPAAIEATDPEDWTSQWEASLNPAAYGRGVERVREYLRCGDAYQVNLTNRYRRPFGGDPRNLFSHLLRSNPAPLSAFVAGGAWSIHSSSPELFFDLSSVGILQTRPIKGTIARKPPDAEAGDTGSNGTSSGGESDFPNQLKGDDLAQAAALTASEKDRAEHLMIVDLERNDLGRICLPGSIEVAPLMALMSLQGIHHMVSNVRGRVRSGVGPAEVFGALFPGGSITGAPKVRVMELIRELESVARGVYTGAIGTITPEGAARFNLAIRTMSLHKGGLDLHVGGGIVIDSDAEAEAAECRLKGAAMARAVRLALEESCSPAAQPT